MSYHVYGQADWFFKDPAAEGATPAPKTAPTAPKTAPPPSPVSAKAVSPTAPPPAPLEYDEEEEGGDLLLYLGIGAAVLALVIIYVKFLRGGSAEAVEEISEPKAKSKPKTIKVEIAMDEDETEAKS